MRLKKKQKSRFDDCLTPLPELLPEPENEAKRKLVVEEPFVSTINKRVKVQNNGDPKYRQYFNNSMNNFMHNSILATISKSKANALDKNILKLKEKLMKTKQLPQGIMSNAAEAAGLELPVMQNYMENHAEKRNVQLWKDHVETHFETTASSLKSRNLSFQSTSSSPPQPPQKEEDLAYRSMSISLKKVLRVLPENVKNVVRAKLQASLVNSSNFQAQFLSVVSMFVLLFKQCTIHYTNGRIDVKDPQGFDIRRLFPPAYVKKNEIDAVMSAQPLSSNIKQAYPEELKSLFTDQHLNLIFTYFFGKEGAKQQNLQQHPLQNALFQKLVALGVVKSPQKCTSTEMQNVVSSVLVNIKNMWIKTTIFNKLLDKLLLTLLRAHLLGNCKPYNKEKKSAPRKEFSTGNKKRNILRAEYKNLNKLRKKLQYSPSSSKILSRISKAEKRIVYFKSLPKKLVPQVLKKPRNPLADNKRSDDSKGNTSKAEISRDRVNAIKSVTKHLLLSRSTVTEFTIKRLLRKPTKGELTAISWITQELSPYIPEKKDRFSIAHQMPLCVLANGVLRETDNAKSTRLLFPTPSFSRLQALQLNPASLYPIFSDGPNVLKLADFNNCAIDSLDCARANKDAVFCSILDMGVVAATCQSYGLEFAHEIKVLPGLETVRILGCRKLRPGEQEVEEPSAVSRTSIILKNPIVIQEGKKKIEQLEGEIELEENELSLLEKDLKSLLKEDLPTKLTSDIKNLKSNRAETQDQDSKDLISNKIAVLKKDRHLEYEKISGTRTRISALKQKLYYKRNAVRLKDQLDADVEVEPQGRPKITSNTLGVLKANQCTIDDHENLVFSGTDNGVVNMSTTTPFTMERYSFHLKLYNKYQVLQNNDDLELSDNEEKYLNLPPVTNLKSADVDVGFGLRKARKILESTKKKTDMGKKVLKAEELLSKNPIKAVHSTSEMLKTVKVYQDQAQLIQKFYTIPKLVRSKRTVEIQKKRYIDQFVTKERHDLVNATGGKWNQLVMLVGDRGTGVGSSIKGHRRYGGKWLECARGKRGPVLITNEHMSSQTCLYCYHKLEHPRRDVLENGKKKKEKVAGTFMCVNPSCVLVKRGRATKSRDALSALAIGLSGASYCLLGETIPCFSPTELGQFNTEHFNNLAARFLKRKGALPGA